MVLYFNIRFSFVQKCPLFYEKCYLTKLLFQKFLNISEMLKRAFPKFSESLKGVVTKYFPGASPPHLIFPSRFFQAGDAPFEVLLLFYIIDNFRKIKLLFDTYAVLCECDSQIKGSMTSM